MQLAIEQTNRDYLVHSFQANPMVSLQTKTHHVEKNKWHNETSGFHGSGQNGGVCFHGKIKLIYVVKRNF